MSKMYWIENKLIINIDQVQKIFYNEKKLQIEIHYIKSAVPDYFYDVSESEWKTVVDDLITKQRNNYDIIQH